MALTTPTLAGPGILPVSRSGPLAFNNDEDDADVAVQCVAAPGAGKAIYVTHITISGRLLDVAVSLRDGDGTVLYGPIQMQANGGGNFTKDWRDPLKLTDNKSLTVFGTNGVAFTIYGEYFIGQAPIV